MSYAVKEIFLTLQGEGAHAGRAAVFCRFSGCNLWSGREQDRGIATCKFCDTDFVGTEGTLGGRYASATELADTIAAQWAGADANRYAVFTGGEPTLRTDIEELVAAARRRLRFRSVMLITNGTLLDRRLSLFENLTGLVISLDALTMDPTNPLSKPAALPKVMENIALAKSRMPNPRTITISTVIEEWNIGEIERILDWAGEQGFVFATQSALNEKMPNLRLIENPRYLELVRKIIERRKQNIQPINGTPRTIETLLRFGDFQCFPTMFPRVYPNGDVFYPCEPLRKIGGNLLREGSLAKVFARGKKLYGEIPDCHGICHLFGNVVSHYYTNDFWRLAGEYIR